jgi:transcriptional regulator with XRE-family HTH domain
MVRAMHGESPARSPDAPTEDDALRPYEFDLIVSGLDIEDPALLDGFEERVGDITFASHGRVVRAAVERKARGLGEAIGSAIADIESIPGTRVVRVEPDEHVSQAEIAVRLGRSRQSISQWVSGSRGPGGFPAPAFESGHVALWRWSEVKAWLRAAGLGTNEDQEHEDQASAVIRAANALLEARRAMAALDGKERERLSTFVPQGLP